MKLFGIIGWKNNGKTTLVEQLLRHLTQRGYRVASVKHAHHQLDLDEQGRDSYRHRQAGATETLLATQQRWALLHEYNNAHGDQSESSLQELVKHFSPCDLILVEGYKQGQHPKIEVVRECHPEGLLFDQVPNVTAIATDLTDLDKHTTQATLLDLNNIPSIADWLLDQLGIQQPSGNSLSVNQRPLGTAVDEPLKNVNDDPDETQTHTSNASPSTESDGCYSPNQALLSANTVWQAMAQAALASNVSPTVSLPLEQCHNRTLAEDIVSPYPSPRFDNAAVDGWAICFTDLAITQGQLPIMATQASAGDRTKLTLTPGHCLRISTGARMPTGADTIVMQEDVVVSAGMATFAASVQAGSNWRPKGEDVKANGCILTKGKNLRPQDIGLAAAAGYAELPVHQPVKVALFSTGNEVHEVGQALPDNAIYDVNRYMLKALFNDLHCEVTDLGILVDDYASIYTALASASQHHQLIVTSGGASTGDHDHIAKALQALGEIQAWRVAIKPGRPLAFGSIGKALFLGLPGNPVAANVCSLMFAAPLLRALQGGGWQQPKPFLEKIGFSVKKHTGRREWLRVYRELQEDGGVLLKRSASHGSGILTSLTKADGLVELDEATSHVNCGDKVRFFPFSGFGIGQLD